MSQKKRHVHLALTEEAFKETEDMCAAYGLSRSGLWEMIIRRVAVDDDVVRRWKERRKRPRNT